MTFSKCRPVVASILLVCAFSSVVRAHTDDPKLLDRLPPYDGPGWRKADGERQANGGPMFFPREGVTLQSWISVTEFSLGFTGANDCWGYASPSGREYAIIGLSGGTGFVEVTNPGDPQIVEIISGTSSLWRDIKTYQSYAYIVTEGSGGNIQVVDLGQIDDGVVTLVNTVSSGGTSRTHNVVIDTTSGFLYRTGGGGNGLRIYDLANPASPAFVASWSDRYVHDAVVVTYTEGPYAGRQIAFCCSGFSGGWVETGVDILDVTNKSNIFLIKRVFYANAAYSHQAWLSPDRQYLYLNDEIDEQDGLVDTTTTRIIDVSDLENAFEAGTFTNGNSAIDHNLYTRDNLIFASNYRSGLRIFDATDPLAPAEIAYFDTWPSDDQAAFNGLWSNYPYLPSGIILGSDREKGLFVWVLDCNDNGSDDGEDVSSGTSPDCNGNGLPDECEAIPDCNGNGQLDTCDIVEGISDDCNENLIADECEVGGNEDCNKNQTMDLCDIFNDTSTDGNSDGIPDECQGTLVVFVDDDGPGDFGPGNPGISDPTEDGSEAHPFDTIQEAIDQMRDFEQANPDQSFIIEIDVADGLYQGPGNRDINFFGRPYHLRSERGPMSCTIDCAGTADDDFRAFVFENGEGSGSVVDGFTIINGSALDGGAVYIFFAGPTIQNCILSENVVLGSGGAIYVAFGSLTVSNCLFVGNLASTRAGAVYTAQGGEALLRNCTIVDNGGSNGGALYTGNGGQTTVIDSILWGNFSNIGDQMYVILAESEINVSFSDVQGGLAGTVALNGGSLNWGAGNIDADPLFVVGPQGGTHYLSQLAAGQATDSPCVDAGSASAASLGLDALATRIDDFGDSDVVDIGFHYPIVPCIVDVYADVDDNGDLDADDLMCMVDGLSGMVDCPGVTFADLDLDACDGGDGDLNLLDLVRLLDALGGAPACPDGCR